MSKINKNIVPEGFNISLALVDFLPVLFFFLASLMLGLNFNSILFIIGSAICFISGFLKVLWKIIVVKKRKNIWPLFMQMRIFMPIGFLLILISFIFACINQDMSKFFSLCLYPLPLIFLIIGVIGMGLMIIFAIKLDSADPKSNWIEQICNSVCQLAFFIAFLSIYLYS